MNRGQLPMQQISYMTLIGVNSTMHLVHPKLLLFVYNVHVWQLHSHDLNNFCRGNNFRSEFSNISEVWSLVPKYTNIMVLTATANLKMRATVIKILEMKGCYVLSHNPNKHNIEVAPKIDLESILCPTVSQVSLKKRETDRYILFC